MRAFAHKAQAVLFVLVIYDFFAKDVEVRVSLRYPGKVRELLNNISSFSGIDLKELELLSKLSISSVMSY